VSKTTTLANGQITAADTLSIALVQAIETPPSCSCTGREPRPSATRKGSEPPGPPSSPSWPRPG
jgi:hypothetical protein